MRKYETFFTWTGTYEKPTPRRRQAQRDCRSNGEAFNMFLGKKNLLIRSKKAIWALHSDEYAAERSGGGT